ncbi:Vacuolar fusion protein mon1 [Rhodotorula toruloides]
MSVEQRRRDEMGKGKAVELDVEEKEVELRPTSREEALADMPRRYFVLSTAGKLVYTSDDDEEAATGLVGVMQAIISIFADEGDKIRYVDVGQTKISFLLKPPLYLVVVSSHGEPENILRMHLDYLYLQVLSVVTLAQLQAIFAKRTNFDLRRMMEGTEPFFDSLVSTLQVSLPMLLSSIEVYRLPTPTREDLARALNPGRDVIRDLDLLYVLLLAKGRLVTLLRPKKHSIHPTDLHLLLSTIYAKRKSASPSPSATPTLNGDPPPPRPPRSSPLLEPGAESWLPICLPRFNPRGFLHAYISFLDVGSSGRSADGSSAEPPEDGVGLVLLSSQRDSFLGVKAAAEGIKARLLASPSATSAATSSSTLPPPAPDGGLSHPLLLFRARQSYSLGELAVPGLRHFVYKDKSKVQVTMCGWEGEYGGEEESEGEKARRRLITLYQHLHTALHPRPAAAGAPSRQAAQVQYLRTEHEAVLGWITSSFELYLATAPLLPHSAVVNAARSISKFVAGKENELFLSNAPSF